MRAFAAPALWLLRHATGLRLYHLLGLAFALAATLAAMAVPFWWLAEQADGVLGPLGFAIAALAYLYATVLVLAFAALLAARMLAGRIRRTLA
jgi:hypothetical protein